ncbi:MAG: hypothetical protein DI536_12090 [Archangium gephyra]|uniref:Glycosyltransferase RgtA/B/C/D-like domain-containing protein n=1 Tax=Archangium gephyra TaxID=48 RepID=A0A2W5TJN6_9BACT|nr:MAG: hypothetical protein DI536_12090 [Archangium gephyra]
MRSARGHRPPWRARLNSEPIDVRELGARVAFALLLMLGAWWAFDHFQPQLLAAKPGTDPNILTPWLIVWSREHDGVELQAAAAGSLVTLGVVFLAIRRRWSFAKLFGWPVQVVIAVLTVGALSRLRATEFEHHPAFDGALRPLLVSLVVAALAHVVGHIVTDRRATWIPVAMLTLPAVTAFCVVTMGMQEDIDYSYLLAPAQKLLQGERLGSFYMQYNLFSTVFTAPLLAFDVDLHRIHLAFGVLFALWLLLYAALAKEVLQKPALVGAFLVALLAVRLVAIRGAPILYPQVSVNRLDLWVPLVLALRKWGVFSPRTAIAMAMGFVADDFFGFLMLGLYVGFVVLHLIEHRDDWGSLRRTAAWCLGAPALVIALHCLIYGSPLAPSATHYANIQLGFLPIEKTSLLWAVLLLFSAALPVVWARSGTQRAVDALLVFIGAAHLIYFYGRSHEHNLLNISGVWLFIAFVFIARVTSLAKPQLALSLAFTTICVFFSSQRAIAKYELVRDVAKNEGVWTYLTKPHVQAPVIDSVRALGWKGRLIAFDHYDGYLQSTLGMEHPGHEAPFFARAQMEDTVRFMIEEMRNGTHVLSLVDRSYWLASFNQRSRVLEEQGVFFAHRPAGRAYEIVLMPR